MIDVAAELAHLEIELLGDEPGMVPLTLIPRSGCDQFRGRSQVLGHFDPRADRQKSSFRRRRVRR